MATLSWIVNGIAPCAMRWPVAAVFTDAAINGFATLFWYYQQLRRMGEGLSPDSGAGWGHGLWY